jgi:hypothetical protein
MLQFNCENYMELVRDVQFTTAAFNEDRCFYICNEEMFKGVAKYTDKNALRPNGNYITACFNGQ